MNLDLNALASKLSPELRERLPLLGAVGGAISLAGLYCAVRRRRLDRRPKTVLVTGCAMGLGRATAEELMRRGDFVVGTDVDEKGLASLKEAFPTLFLGLKMDVSNAESVAAVVAEVRKFSGGKECLDAIVNNAGILRGGPLVELPDNHMAAIMSVNVVGTFLVSKHFFPLLRRSATDEYKPRIINFGSEISYAGVSAIMNAPYAMSKFAIEAFSTSLRQELALINPPAHVVTVNPGAHASNMTEKTGSHFGSAAVKAQSKYFSNVLEKMESLAQFYMDTNKHPASDLAIRIWQLVHAVNPPKRAPINVSTQMYLAKYTPQCVLDFVTINGLKLLF